MTLDAGIVVALVSGTAVILVAFLTLKKDKAETARAGDGTTVGQLLQRLEHVEEQQANLSKINAAQWYYITILQRWGSYSVDPTPREVPAPPPLLVGAG